MTLAWPLGLYVRVLQIIQTLPQGGEEWGQTDLMKSPSLSPAIPSWQEHQ